MANEFIPLSDIVLPEEDVRLTERSVETVNTYAANITLLPPIDIDQDYRILDGVHRYLAHKTAGSKKIEVNVFHIEDEAQAIEHSIAANATHGVPLTSAEIIHNCIRLCELGRSNREIAEKVKRHETVVGKHVKATRERMENERAEKLGKLYEIRDENDKRIYTHDKLKVEIGQSEKRVATLLDRYFANEMTELLESKDLTDEELIEKFDITSQRMERINEKFGDTLRPPEPEPKPDPGREPENEAEEVDQEVIEAIAEKEPNTKPEPQTVAKAKVVVDEDDESKRIHKQIQWMLLWLGNELSLNLWLPRTDFTQSHKKNELANLAGRLKDLPFNILKAGRPVQRIDVLWLKDDKIIAAFEIENSTGIESGLFRMSHMWVSMNDSSIRTYIVAPDTDINRAGDKISEPTFRHNGLAESCWFIPYTRLTDIYEAEQYDLTSYGWQALLDEIGHKLQ